MIRVSSRPSAKSARLLVAGAFFVSLALPSLGSMCPALAATASLHLSPTIGPPTTSVTATGAGFLAGERVALWFDSIWVAGATAGSSGTFNKAFTVPASARPGVHTVKAVGKSSGRSATAPFTVRTNWPQFRDGPAHNGFNRYENVVTASNAWKLHAVWTKAVGSAHSSPAVAGGTVYLSTGTGLYAFWATTGAQRWSVTVPSVLAGGVSEVASSPAVSGGRVFLGSTDGNLYAFSTSTGTRLWVAATGGAILSSPTVVGATVYVGSNDGYLYAVDVATGARRWRAFTSDAPVDSSPAVSGGVVYVGAGDGHVYAFAASTGVLKWQSAYEASSGWYGSEIVSSPAVAYGMVYVQADSQYLVALDASTGTVMWTGSYGGEADQSSPAVANGTVFMVSGEYVGGGFTTGEVAAVDAFTGALKWSAYSNSYNTSSPAVGGGVVYFTSEDGHLYCLSADTGNLLRKITVAPDYVGLSSSPAVSDGRVIVSGGSTYSFGVKLS